MSPSDAASNNKNAFAVLMGKKVDDHNNSVHGKAHAATWTRPAIGTEFVCCPAGCGKRMLEKDVNVHLDLCIGQPHETASAHEETPQPNGSKTIDKVENRRLSTWSVDGVHFSKKRRRVICPACEKSFPTSLINLHLDQCVTRAKSTTSYCSKVVEPFMEGETLSSSKGANIVSPESLNDSTNSSLAPPVGVYEATNHEDKIDTKFIEDSPIRQHVHVHEKTTTGFSVFATSTTGSQTSDLSKQQTPCHNPIHTKIVSQSPDPDSVFATMMKQSKTVFAKRDSGSSSSTLHLMFHLDESFRITLSYPMSVETEWTPPNWSMLMHLRDRHPVPNLEYPATTAATTTQNIDVTVSTAIPSYHEPLRWVRRHSRLSVPVLKSILQKSIRRRKPLPAVRAAMELADKSFGDLLRRLPIIMFEDSTLHPDINFLIWMMMAHSKDYQPSPKLVVRIFQIIYEIAACQWSDTILSALTSADAMMDVDSKEKPTAMTLSSLFASRHENGAHRTDVSSFNDTSTTFIWSMLVRADYGGMKCDVQMLHRYAIVWYHRLTSQIVVPEAIVNQLLIIKSATNSTLLLWSDVPALIHQKSREQGMDRVTSLCTNGIDRLLLGDICVEGIDFHCSNIIGELLADEQLCGLCCDLMILANLHNDCHSSPRVPESLDECRACLQDIFKTTIWNFSSNINHRRALQANSNSISSSSDDHPPHRNLELWNDWIAPRALCYQKNYVTQRLA
jgi:hypothetical protein